MTICAEAQASPRRRSDRRLGSGRGWANSVAGDAKQYRNMGVTYSSAGEYGNAIDILPPA
jgi:hypothetical protein